jgi:hypothetical protein
LAAEESIMLRTVLLSIAMTLALGSGAAFAAASTAPATHNPNCDPITNPVLKKACLAQPPPSCNDPSKPTTGNGNGHGNGDGNPACPVSK